MNFIQALNEVRRKMGIITQSKEDVIWMCEKIVRENKKVFDNLAKS